MDIDIHTVRAALWIVLRSFRVLLTPSNKPIARSTTPIKPQPPVVVPTPIPVKKEETPILTLKNRRPVFRFRVKAELTYLQTTDNPKIKKRKTTTILQMDETMSEFIRICNDCVSKMEPLGYQLTNIQITRQIHLTQEEKEQIREHTTTKNTDHVIL